MRQGQLTHLVCLGLEELGWLRVIPQSTKAQDPMLLHCCRQLDRLAQQAPIEGHRWPPQVPFLDMPSVRFAPHSPPGRDAPGRLVSLITLDWYSAGGDLLTGLDIKHDKGARERWLRRLALLHKQIPTIRRPAHVADLATSAQPCLTDRPRSYHAQLTRTATPSPDKRLPVRRPAQHRHRRVCDYGITSTKSLDNAFCSHLIDPVQTVH